MIRGNRPIFFSLACQILMTCLGSLIRLPAMREDLVPYFIQVLGIREVLRPFTQDAPVVAEPMAEQKKPMVLFIDDRPWTVPTADLFKKMWQAMKLTSEQVQVLFLESEGAPTSKSDLQLKALSATAVVNFSHEALEELPTDIQFHTVSPSRLIENPALKKEVWSELQKVMLALRHSPPMG